MQALVLHLIYNDVRLHLHAHARPRTHTQVSRHYYDELEVFSNLRTPVVDIVPSERFNHSQVRPGLCQKEPFALGMRNVHGQPCRMHHGWIARVPLLSAATFLVVSSSCNFSSGVLVHTCCGQCMLRSYLLWPVRVCCVHTCCVRARSYLLWPVHAAFIPAVASACVLCSYLLWPVYAAFIPAVASACVLCSYLLRACSFILAVASACVLCSYLLRACCVHTCCGQCVCAVFIPVAGVLVHTCCGQCVRTIPLVAHALWQSFSLRHACHSLLHAPRRGIPLLAAYMCSFIGGLCIVTSFSFRRHTPCGMHAQFLVAYYYPPPLPGPKAPSALPVVVHHKRRWVVLHTYGAMHT